MNKEELRLWIDEFCEDYFVDDGILLADGFERAFIGVGTKFNAYAAVYDRTECLSILMEGGMTLEEAMEYFEFNVTGAYVGDSTPIFMIDMIEK